MIIESMKVNLLLFWIYAILAIPLLTGCAKPVETAPLEEVKSDKLVARVASIHHEEGYALIQRYGRLKLSDDAILYTLSVDGETSNLKVSGERLGQFVAVDIMSGELNVGDAVYLRDLTERGNPDNKVKLNKGET